jgi:hypothetical protein
MSPTRSLDCVPLPEMDAKHQNRRRSARVYCRVPVTLRSSDGRDIQATCLDVNHNGIGIETHNQLAVGQRLQLLVPKNGDVKAVPMLVMFRMNTHYGLSALDAYEHVLDLIPTQA